MHGIGYLFLHPYQESMILQDMLCKLKRLKKSATNEF